MMETKTVAVTSSANRTKWTELQRYMAAQPGRAPLWKTKYLPGKLKAAWRVPDGTARPSIPSYDYLWDGEWYYHFRSDNEYERIEWCDLKCGSKPDAMSLDEIAEICTTIGLDFERQGEIIRVYGYRRSG
jgi:hypothetical protein